MFPLLLGNYFHEQLAAQQECVDSLYQSVGNSYMSNVAPLSHCHGGQALLLKTLGIGGSLKLLLLNPLLALVEDALAKHYYTDQ
jgi:hypothetical protein